MEKLSFQFMPSEMWKRRCGKGGAEVEKHKCKSLDFGKVEFKISTLRVTENAKSGKAIAEAEKRKYKILDF